MSGVATISITNARDRGTPTPLATARAYLMLADFSSSVPRKIKMKVHADHMKHRAAKMTVAKNGASKAKK